MVAGPGRTLRRRNVPIEPRLDSNAIMQGVPLSSGPALKGGHGLKALIAKNHGAPGQGFNLSINTLFLRNQQTPPGTLKIDRFVSIKVKKIIYSLYK